MKTSEVLTKVRRHLGNGTRILYSHQRYVCFALEYLYYDAKVIGDKDRTRVKKLIRGHLDGAETLEEWLFANHGIRYTGSTRYNKKIMATRKAWLTHLIEHYEAKGD